MKRFPFIRLAFRFVLGVALLWTALFANFDLAERAYQNRVYNFAIINYEKSLLEDRDPLKKEKSLYRLADSYYQIGKMDEAEKWARDYIESYSSGKWVSEVKYLQALVWVKKKNYSQAQKIIVSLIQDYPKYLEVHKLVFTLAQIYQDIGNYDLAIETLKKTLGAYDFDRNYLKARIHYLNQNYQIALVEIEKVKKEELKVFSLDKSVDLHVEILLKVEEYDRARSLMKEYFYRLKNSEIKSKFLFYQSHINYLQGDYSKAIVNYKNYLDKERTSPFRNDALFFLALTYYRVEQPIIALEYIVRLEVTKVEAELSEVDKARKNKLAYLIYKKLDRQQKQGEYLEKLTYPGSPEELFGMTEKIKALALKNDYGGKEQPLTKNMKNYLERYKKLEGNSEDQAAFYNSIAEIYFGNNNSSLSMVFSQLAFASSSDPSYLLGLADRLSVLEQYGQAIEVYKSFLPQVQGEKRHYVLDALGYASFENGDYKNSIKYYRENLKSIGSNKSEYLSSALFYLGENHRLLQEYRPAEKYFNRFLELFPGDERGSLVNLNLGFIHYYGDKDCRKVLRSLNQAYKLQSSLQNSKNRLDGIDLRNHIFQLRFRCYLDLGDEKNAVEQLGFISKRDDPNLYYDNLLILAKYYFNRQNYQLSLSQYYEIINSENSDARPDDKVLEKAYFERVTIKLKEESGREAYFYLAKLKKRFPESPLVREAFLSIGDYYYSKEKWISAETVFSAFEKYASEPADRIYVLYYLGFIRQQVGKKEEAYANFKTVKEIGDSKKIFNSYYFDSLFELGIFEFDDKRLSQAKKNFQAIVDRSPNKDLRNKAKENLNIIEAMADPNPYSGLKTVESISKKIEKVSAPSLKDQGYYLIGEIYFNSGNYQLAYETVKRIVPPSRYYEDAMMLALKSLLALDRFEDAYAYGMKSYFTLGISLAEDKQEYLYYVLAYTSKTLERKADYEKFLRLLTKEFPNTEYLKIK